MYVVLLPIQCKDGAKEQVLATLVPNAQVALETEPGATGLMLSKTPETPTGYGCIRSTPTKPHSRLTNSPSTSRVPEKSSAPWRKIYKASREPNPVAL